MRTTDAVRCLLFLAIAVCLTSSTNAAVIVGLILNPASTAGGGATSTRFGPGSWQLYAIDDSNVDLGISSYNIALSGTTAINHRSPVTTISDTNGDPQTAGFSLLRTGTNVNPIQASQGLPGTTPFLVTGFGQTAGDFCTVAGGVCLAVVGPTNSGAWGNYARPGLSNAAFLTGIGSPAAGAAVAAGKKWVFLAEGLGPAGATSVTSAVVTVFTDPRTYTAQVITLSVVVWNEIPEPSSVALLLAGLVGFLPTVRRRSSRY